MTCSSNRPDTPLLRLTVVSALASALLCGASAARAQVTMPLNVNGTLVIQGGGTNTGVVQYTAATIAPGSSDVTISLSASFPTLVIRGGKAPGQSCSTGGDCWTTDFCEDGVCCCNCSPASTVINGVSTVTCYRGQYPSAACPIYGDGNDAGTSYQCANCAACAAPNGRCAAAAQSRSSARGSSTCRLVADLCDQAEQCSGTSMFCPADTHLAAGTQCRNASGLGCDGVALCTGTAASCPPNPLLAQGTVCNATDLARCRGTASCTGTSNACPLGPLLANGTVCQLPQGPCGLTSRCDGATASCPVAYLAAGTVCGASGAKCTGGAASCPDPAGGGSCQ